VIPPEIAPTVQAKELDADAAKLILGLEPLQTVAVLAVVTTVVGLTVIVMV
jgi:hypothetical protein